jgi:hypothetical protein
MTDKVHPHPFLMGFYKLFSSRQEKYSTLSVLAVDTLSSKNNGRVKHLSIGFL